MNTSPGNFSDNRNQVRNTLHINDLPQELLLEIFKYLPIEDLNSRVKLVCKRWRKIASTCHLYPSALVISRRSNPKTIFHLLTTCNETLTKIEFQNVHETGIATSLSLNWWPNLKTLSLKWKHIALDGVRIPVARLICMIDRCPKLREIELRECFVYGDMNTLTAKIQDRGIDRITFMNKYLVVDGIEKLFALCNMTKFRVYAHFFCEPDAQSSICMLCGNNRYSLTSLGLRLDNANEDSFNSIVTCTQLRHLDLVGKFKISLQRMLRIGELLKLQSLKIEVYHLSSDEFATFLKLPFTQRLYQLSVYWSRRVGEEELTSLAYCKNVTKLTVSFADHYSDMDMISNVLVQLVQILPLEKLKIISNFSILNHLPEICSNAKDLFRIKLVQNYKCKSEGNYIMKLHRLKYLYDFKYYSIGSGLEILLYKKIRR